MLTIFEAIIDKALAQGALPMAYATWDPDQLNKAIFDSFNDLKANKAKLPNSIKSLNTVLKAYSDEIESISHDKSQWDANLDFINTNGNFNEELKGKIIFLIKEREKYIAIPH